MADGRLFEINPGVAASWKRRKKPNGKSYTWKEIGKILALEQKRPSPYQGGSVYTAVRRMKNAR